MKFHCRIGPDGLLLTAKSFQMLWRLKYAGRSNRQIAKTMNVSPSTVSRVLKDTGDFDTGDLMLT